MKFINKKNFFLFCLLLLLSLPSIFPLFHGGFFVTDDGEWMIIRLSAFYQSLADGQIPVRFLGRLNHEYGYPVSTFLYPGYLYLGSIIHLLKIGFVESIKILFGISMLSSFAFCYLWLRKFFDKTSSIIGSLVFLYAPYHLYDLFVRGSVGEVIALAVAPFILWQIERKSIFYSSIGIGLLILSHNSLSVLFIGLIIVYLLLNITISANRKRFAYLYATIMILGFGLGAFYWVPAITELQYTIFSETKISDWSGYFADINLIGFPLVFVFILTLFVFLRNKALLREHRLTMLFLIIGLCSTFLSAKISTPLWNVLPSNLFQFPFRFLSVSMLCAGFLTSFIISVLKGIYRNLFILAIVFLLAISYFKFVSSIKYFDKGEGFYTTNNATTTVHDEYLPKWVRQKQIERPSEKVVIIEGDGVVGNILSNNKTISFDANLKRDSLIQVNTIYWPGWTAKVDGNPIDISYDNPNGVMRLKLSKDTRSVSLQFTETQTRLFADIISIVSVVTLIVFSKSKRYKIR